ncbi:RNA 3'-terminal phosphate cyclase domain-containing protein [Obelidium mucronatum]|nr:RNA 3'-terminal phosphate cyclase domain-containing protein [Obelidium mucronatum]
MPSHSSASNKKAKLSSSSKTTSSSTSGPNPSILRFEGHLHLRQRLLLATISGRTVRIDKIRQNEDEFPGLADYEVSFLRLLEKLTNGSHLEISYTGSSLLYKPGVITGGKITHDCPPSRAIGYFLEPLIAIAPFAKVAFHLTLNGITNDNVDICVDTLRTVTLPTLKKFLPSIETSNAPLDLKITKRGAPPLGGGQVIFQCPIIKSLKPGVLLTDPGLGVKRIRGIAYATRISPQMANRVVDSARSLLSRYIPDVYLYTDVYKGAESGKGPGYGVSLVAETTTGVLYSAEWIVGHLQNDYTFPTPEDLGIRAARVLLTEIRKGGCVDANSQWLAILLLALGPEDVGKVRVGTLTPFSIQLLRDLKQFLGVVFKIGEEPQEEGTVVLTCLGTGYVNVNKNVT